MQVNAIGEEDHRGDNPALSVVVERNIRTIIQIRQKAERKRGIQDRLADAITLFSGRMVFAYVHVVWFVVWILLNEDECPAGDDRGVKPGEQPFPRQVKDMPAHQRTRHGNVGRPQSDIPGPRNTADAKAFSGLGRLSPPVRHSRSVLRPPSTRNPGDHPVTHISIRSRLLPADGVHTFTPGSSPSGV